MRTAFLGILAIAACGAAPAARDKSAGTAARDESAATAARDENVAPVPVPTPGRAAAVFAGGCFWCVESDFDKAPGVVSTTSGFAGGTTENPTYAQVSSHTTDQIESVYVIYDTSKTTYEALLDYYWHHIDPTDGGGQFCDRGETYRPAILTLDDAQRAAAEASKKALEARKVLPGPVVVEVAPAIRFWAAEEYHQDFHDKEPAHYLLYRTGCGRDAKVRQVWSKE
jgi:peptide-methionine (S)-S-oxide reductase